MKRFVRLIQIKLAKLMIKILLPHNLWVGKHRGAYTQKWDVILGRLDSRGVLQGIEDDKALESEEE